MNGKIASNETILDHVVAYTIGAGEVMQENCSKSMKHTSKYKNALIPFGPPFYTAILQAAGTLSIKKNSKTALIIYQQTSNPDKILIFNQPVGPILGKTFAFPEQLKPIFTKFPHDALAINTIDQNIENQIHFIRILSTAASLVMIGVGQEIEKSKINKILEYIKKQTSETVTFFVSNLSEAQEFTLGRKSDETLITNIISRKFKQGSVKHPLITQLFSETSKKEKKIPEIVAYTNSGDLGGNKKTTNGYACLIA